MRILDLGTGSGAIACALALELEGVRRVVGSDRSVDALAVARANADRLGNPPVCWVAADGLAAFRPGDTFHAIVANLPYIADVERAELPVEVAGWEPPGALFAGPVGTEAIATAIAEAPARLAREGLLALEVGRGQEAETRRRIETSAGLEFLGSYRDLAGIPRGILAVAGREG